MKGITSWYSPKVEVKKSHIIGRGLFARKQIKKDEVIAIKGGHVVDSKTFFSLDALYQHASLQISNELFITPLAKDEVDRVMIFINHSCTPNVGLSGQLATVAMRDIEPGEELTGDYAVAYSNSFFEFRCLCKNAGCRGLITSEDWKKPQLQKKYKGYFGAYLTTMAKK